MRHTSCFTVIAVILMSAFLVTGFSQPALADTAAQIDRDVNNALKKLYAGSPAARELSKIAKGILVFPSIIKGGFIIAGQYGEGALRIDGKTTGYYNTVAASYGFQAGAQSFGYVLFFTDQEALNYLYNSDGWEVGVGPSVVVVDQGFAKTLSSTTAKEAVYAFFFSQKGLMAGMGIQGTKISKITPGKK
jgi:lipid-binding SYLF domain-containing protein